MLRCEAPPQQLVKELVHNWVGESAEVPANQPQRFVTSSGQLLGAVLGMRKAKRVFTMRWWVNLLAVDGREMVNIQ